MDRYTKIERRKKEETQRNCPTILLDSNLNEKKLHNFLIGDADGEKQPLKPYLCDR